MLYYTFTQTLFFYYTIALLSSELNCAIEISSVFYFILSLPSLQKMMCAGSYHKIAGY